MLKCIRIMGNYNSVESTNGDLSSNGNFNSNNNNNNSGSGMSNVGTGGSNIGVNHGLSFNEHFYGLVNFGNTCYVNSVLQALYFCRPFREKIIQYKLQQSSKLNKASQQKEHLLNCLAELFYMIVSMKKKKGIVQPKKFIARLRKDNESFDNLFQQDAHEFLNYLLNTCADILKEEMKEEEQHQQQQQQQQHLNDSPKLLLKKDKFKLNGTNTLLTPNSSSSTLNSLKTKLLKNSQVNVNNTEVSHDNALSFTDETWIHELFQGILVNETTCLNCDTCSSKEENFLDLSVDVDQNTSLSHCLQEFSSMEMLCGECKYYCDKCSSKQEAEKRMRVKKLPKILALHLKRFKFMSDLNRFKKLTYRVVFPFELRLLNTTEDCVNGDRVYDLVSFVVHCGIGLNRGHYITVVKSGDDWFLFDDEQVEKVEVSSFEDFYGLAQDKNKKSETSYILFYESRES